MLDMTPQVKETAQLIKRYGDGCFVIAEKEVQGPVIIWPGHHAAWEKVLLPQDINVEAMAQLLTEEHPIEIVVIGTGKEMAPISAAVRQLLREKKIGVEVLDTGAACRTFNILLAEERRVAAALLPV